MKESISAAATGVRGKVGDIYEKNKMVFSSEPDKINPLKVFNLANKLPETSPEKKAKKIKIDES